MQGANTDSEPATSLHDSVVSGDVHTGNIIHNHYHITQTAPAPQTLVHQVVQPAAQIQQRPLVPVDLSGNDSLMNGERNIVTAYLLCICFGYVGASILVIPHWGSPTSSPLHFSDSDGSWTSSRFPTWCEIEIGFTCPQVD